MRTSSSLQAVLLGVAITMSLGSYSCRIGPTPPVGTQGLQVPFHRQRFDATSQARNYCVPASILMLRDFYAGGYSSDGAQHQYWNDFAAAGWTAPGGLGVLTQHLAAAFTWKLNLPFQLQVYQGSDGKVNALADAEKSLALNHPVPAMAFGGAHMVVIKKVTWDTPPAAGSRPVQYGVVVNDPEWPGPDRVFALPVWLNDIGSACTNYGCAANVSHLPRSIGAAELGEFEAAAGTAYSEGAPPVLASGEMLYPSQNVRSRDGRFMLVYQTDGNLVMYGPSGAVWHAGTNGSSAGLTAMQTDGNLVVYNAGGVAQWWSGTSGHSGAYLSVHDSGHAAISSQPFAELWRVGSSGGGGGGGGGGGSTGSGTLPSGGSLYVGQALWSPGGNYYLNLQSDGNLVLKMSDGTPLWATGTSGTSADRLAMQGDGNLVLYDAVGTPVWATMTNVSMGASLAVQDDTNLVVYSSSGVPLWAR